MNAKRLIPGIVISLLVVIVPACANPDALRAAHLWIVCLLGVLASALQPAYNPFTITAKPKDKWTGAQILWTVYLCQLAAVIEATTLRYPQSMQWNSIVILALGLAILGLCLRSWAVATLGKHFTMHIDVQDDHAIITNGPFALVRHPSYLGAFVMVVASIAFLQAWFALAVAIPALLFAFLRRIHHEEKLLLAHRGDAYSAYRARVHALLPGIW